MISTPPPCRALPARLLSAFPLALAAAVLATLVPLRAANPPIPTYPSTPQPGNTPPAPPPSPELPQRVPTLPTQTTSSAISTAPGIGPGDPIPTDLPKPLLPIPFANFASDYKPKELPQKWVTVSFSFVEFEDAPPEGQQVFMLDQLPGVVVEQLRPIEISCILGAKSKYENVTVIDHDPKGRLIPYQTPLGTTVYFLAREEKSGGFDISFYYYNAGALTWIPNPVQEGLMPVPSVIAQQQDIVVPANKYVFITATHRIGSPRRGSTARPVDVFGYIVLQLRKLESPAARPAPTETSSPSSTYRRGDVLNDPPRSSSTSP